VIELRRVQHIESLGAKLQAMACALIEGEIFEHGEINLSGSRSEENVSSRVPEYVIARRNKIGCIEPGVDVGIVQFPGAKAIGPLCGIAGVEKTAHHYRSERRSGGKCPDAVQPPAPDGGLQQAMGTARKPLTRAKRKVVRPAQDQE